MSCLASCFGTCIATSCVKGLCSLFNTKSRAPYLYMFFITAIGTAVAHVVSGKKIDLGIKTFTLCSSEQCREFGVVYRVCFALALFYCIMSLLVTMTAKPRNWDYHNWGIKFLILIALIFATWFIPTVVYSNFVLQVMRGGAGLFILLKCVSVIDWTCILQSSWLAKEMYRAILAASVVFLACSVTLLVFIFKWFAGSGCTGFTVMIVVVLLLTVVFIALSVSSLSRYGILPSAILTLYAYYSLFSALSNSTGPCNTSPFSIAGNHRESDLDTVRLVVSVIVSVCAMSYTAWKFANNSSGGGDIEEGRITNGETKVSLHV